MIRMLALIATLTSAAMAADAPAPAAKPVDCLQTRSITQAQPGSDHHWYAKTRDGKWYRNAMECPSLGLGRALVHVSPIGSQCRGDIVQVVDFTLGGMNFGGCGMGRWEPVDGLPGKPAKAK